MPVCSERKGESIQYVETVESETVEPKVQGKTVALKNKYWSTAVQITSAPLFDARDMQRLTKETAVAEGVVLTSPAVATGLPVNVMLPDDDAA